MKRSVNNILEWHKHKNLPDQWWVAISGEVRDDTYTLDSVIRHFRGMPVAVLNVEESGNENPEWIVVGWDAEREDKNSLPNADISKIISRIDSLQDEVSTMHKALGEVVAFLNEMHVLQEAKHNIQERLDQLEAREQDIEKSELLLIERMNRLEEDQVALAQKTDNHKADTEKRKIVNFG